MNNMSPFEPTPMQAAHRILCAQLAVDLFAFMQALGYHVGGSPYWILIQQVVDVCACRMLRMREPDSATTMRVSLAADHQLESTIIAWLDELTQDCF